mgnify:CR=1 FL=1
MSKSVTMRDIADKLEISVAAVSKALTGKSGVSAELRSKVKRTADEMGYKFDVETKKKSSRSSIHSRHIKSTPAARKLRPFPYSYGQK